MWTCAHTFVEWVLYDGVENDMTEAYAEFSAAWSALSALVPQDSLAHPSSHLLTLSAVLRHNPPLLAEHTLAMQQFRSNMAAQP